MHSKDISVPGENDHTQFIGIQSHHQRSRKYWNRNWSKCRIPHPVCLQNNDWWCFQKTSWRTLWNYECYLNGHNGAIFSLLKILLSAILTRRMSSPSQEIFPHQQKTRIDFCAQSYIGIKPVCLTERTDQEGKNFTSTTERRSQTVYNRVIFDDLQQQKHQRMRRKGKFCLKNWMWNVPLTPTGFTASVNTRCHWSVTLCAPDFFIWMK